MNIEVDSHKLIYHPERVDEWVKRGDCFPIYVEIGPTNKCNHRCVFCSLDWVEKGVREIDKDVMISNLRDMAVGGVKSVMFAGEGEPLLHSSIELFIQKSKEYGLDVSMSTNGVIFTREKIEKCLPKLSWVRFSINAGVPEKYSMIHKTNANDFSRVVENIRKAAQYKRENKLNTTIGTQMVMIPENIGDVKELILTLKEAGADNLQLKPYSHHPNTKNFFSVDKKEYDKIKELTKQFNSPDFNILFRESTIDRMNEGVTYPKCYGLPFFALIDSKGNVLPCNRFYNNEEFIYGNLYEKKFSEIWWGQKRKDFFDKINIAECGKGCKLDVVNKYLQRLKNPHPHDNFI